MGGHNAGDGRRIVRGKDYIGHTCGYEPRKGSNERQLTREEAEANARLIAAAPELLAACERMIAVFGRVSDGTPKQCQDEVAALESTRETLRKAKGGQ